MLFVTQKQETEKNVSVTTRDTFVAKKKATGGTGTTTFQLHKDVVAPHFLLEHKCRLKNVSLGKIVHCFLAARVCHLPSQKAHLHVFQFPSDDWPPCLHPPTLFRALLLCSLGDCCLLLRLRKHRQTAHLLVQEEQVPRASSVEVMASRKICTLSLHKCLLVCCLHCRSIPGMLHRPSGCAELPAVDGGIAAAVDGEARTVKGFAAL